MKPVFVKTENVQKLMVGLSALERRGAGEACLMVIDGLPGLGKSRALSWFAAQNDCPFVRAKKEWTPNWMLAELLAALNIAHPPHGFEKRFALCLETLAARADAAARAGENFAVIVDEVDYIARSDKMLSSLRDLSDFLEIPFLLVGMGKVRHGLKHFPQVTSRIGQYVEFKPLTRDDVAGMVNGLCDVTVQADLIALIHDYSKGFVREIKEAIASVERVAHRNGLREAGCMEMAGQVLMNDRTTGKPIIVSQSWGTANAA